MIGSAVKGSWVAVRAECTCLEEQREMGLPWSEALAKRAFIAPGGTVLAGLLAL